MATPADGASETLACIPTCATGDRPSAFTRTTNSEELHPQLPKPRVRCYRNLAERSAQLGDKMQNGCARTSARNKSVARPERLPERNRGKVATATGAHPRKHRSRTTRGRTKSPISPNTVGASSAIPTAAILVAGRQVDRNARWCRGLPESKPATTCCRSLPESEPATMCQQDVRLDKQKCNDTQKDKCNNLHWLTT